MDIRSVKSDEVEGLLPLWREMMGEHARVEGIYKLREDAEGVALEHFRRVCGAEDRLLLVCWEEGICGYLSASVRPAATVFAAEAVGVINELAVGSAFRRRGIGRRLFEEARQWMAGRGIRRVEVRTLIQNELSNAFWRKMGLEVYAAEWKGSTKQL
jgi:GNAT superfamily N-acetyltransferase